MSQIYVKIKKVRDNAKIPTYGSEHAAGADLYACINVEQNIPAGETVLVPTGIAAEIPESYVGLICARSGIATKRGLAPANKVGVIDSDYRGEILVPLHNHSKTSVSILPCERIAQILFLPVSMALFSEIEEIEDTVRGSDGFGSTGRV